MVVSGGDCGIMGMRHGILVGTHTVTNNMICGCVCQGLAHTSWLAAFPAQGFVRCQRVGVSANMLLQYFWQFWRGNWWLNMKFRGNSLRWPTSSGMRTSTGALDGHQGSRFAQKWEILHPLKKTVLMGKMMGKWGFNPWDGMVLMEELLMAGRFIVSGPHNLNKSNHASDWDFARQNWSCQRSCVSSKPWI